MGSEDSGRLLRWRYSVIFELMAGRCLPERGLWSYRLYTDQIETDTCIQTRLRSGRAQT